MELVRMSIAATFLVAVFSISSVANAVVVSVDWQTAGDNLITRDDVSGLDWLDLTETNGISRDDILPMLSGGIYDGWRYATSNEVVTLWANFNVDLTYTPYGDALYASFLDPGVVSAATILGNTSCEYDCVGNPYGARGLTADGPNPNPFFLGWYNVMGAYGSTGTFYDIAYSLYTAPSNSTLHIGHYLVQTSVVPVPGTVWLFSSGLLGFIGVAKRKKA